MFSERTKPTNLETTEVKLPEEMQNLINELQNLNKPLFVIANDVTDENSASDSLEISDNIQVVKQIREGFITTTDQAKNSIDELKNSLLQRLEKYTSR